MRAHFELREGLPLDRPEETHLAVIREIGHPFGYIEERAGALVHDVTPMPGYEATESSRGKARFGAHSDCAFLPAEYRPEFLSLFCLVNEAATPTLLWEANRLVEALDPRWVEVLSAPRFLQAAPVSFDWDGPPPVIEDHRVLERVGRDWRIAYSAQGTRPADWEAARALAALENAVEETEPRRIILRPGSLLILDNLRCLHGRDEIRGERWLQRVYSRRDLSKFPTSARTSTPDVLSAFSALQLVQAQPALSAG